MKIVIVGGGWAGCAASAQAAKSGASVTLLELPAGNRPCGRYHTQ